MILFKQSYFFNVFNYTYIINDVLIKWFDIFNLLQFFCWYSFLQYLDASGNPVTQSVVSVTDASGNPVTGNLITSPKEILRPIYIFLSKSILLLFSLFHILYR